MIAMWPLHSVDWALRRIIRSSGLAKLMEWVGKSRSQQIVGS